jgi:cytochrome P450
MNEDLNTESTETRKCPVSHQRVLPTDGTPLKPSPVLAEWAMEGKASPLSFTDGHQGWIVTDHALARDLLADSRFSQLPQRIPGALTEVAFGNQEPDERAEEASRLAGLLALDGPEHARIRRTILGKFSVRSAREHEPKVREIVNKQISHIRTLGPGVDLEHEYANPISTAVHGHVLGIPEHLQDKYYRLFVGESTHAEKVYFVREVLENKRLNPDDSVLGEMIKSDLSDVEEEGLAFVLFVSGRDSVAYMITTATVALLQNPSEMEKLRNDSSLIPAAIEEFMRYGAMFLTLFARTATEDVELQGFRFSKGDSVAVSPVAANRNSQVFPDPNQFDVTRDAFGHLGFGHGIHGCVGQQLARVEIRVAIENLITNFPQLRLLEAEQNRPMEFAHPVATYQAGKATVSW